MRCSFSLIGYIKKENGTTGRVELRMEDYWLGQLQSRLFEAHTDISKLFSDPISSVYVLHKPEGKRTITSKHCKEGNFVLCSMATVHTVLGMLKPLFPWDFKMPNSVAVVLIFSTEDYGGFLSLRYLLL